MEPLVQWLLGGLILSLLFIGIARWFWTRYDKPSEEALEWQKEQAEKRKERKVWESVEMQMRREAEEAEIAANKAKIEFENEWLHTFENSVDEPKKNYTLGSNKKSSTKSKALNTIKSEGLKNLFDKL